MFKLGTKYSESLSARFLDQTEQLRPIIMGCYGIGINRIIAALIETCHDANGIIWPMSLAPYEVLLAPVKVTVLPVVKPSPLIVNSWAVVPLAVKVEVVFAVTTGVTVATCTAAVPLT